MDDQHNDCLFCKIAAGDIPTKLIYQDESVVAFNDIDPKAPIHILVIPRTHIPSVDRLKPENEQLIGAMVFAAQKIARNKEIAETGYRLVFNTHAHAGQTVDHIHLHILGGKRLGPMA